jgi:hypothetical protein
MANSEVAGEGTYSLLAIRLKSIAPQVGFPPLAAPRPTDPPMMGKPITLAMPCAPGT